jgi:hypothetical protein
MGSVVFLVGVPWLLTEGGRWLIKTAAPNSAPLILKEKETSKIFGVFSQKPNISLHCKRKEKTLY